MAVIALRAMVKLFHEQFMRYPEGVIPDEKAKWVYRLMGVDANDIYRVIRYNKTKSIVKDIWGETILIDEPFEEVFKKWSENKTQNLDISDDEISDEEDEFDEE